MTEFTPRYLFICGLHRSGTSLLRRILGEHPDISIFRDTDAPEDEGQHLQTVFPPARIFGGPGKFCFDENARLNETSPLLTPENQHTLTREWERYWDSSKRVLVEKSPPNLIHMRFLQAMFPDSAFLIIARHPIAVSYATQKWSNTPIAELVEHWVKAHQILLEDLPFIQRSFFIRYENFVQSPREAIDMIYQAIGLNPVPFIGKVDPNINNGYFSQWEAEKPVVNLSHALPHQFGYYFSPPYVGECPASLTS